MQAKLLHHVCRYSEAYLSLLLPHAGDNRVAQLLSTLARHGTLEDALPDGAAALDYLQLLTALARQLGDMWSGAGAGGGAQALAEGHAELLAAVSASMVAAMAVIEGQARQRLADELCKKKGRKPSPERVQERVEQEIRCGCCQSGHARLATSEVARLRG